VPRQESVESFLGGCGLYYRSPLTDLGVVVARGTPTANGEATPVDVVLPSGLGERLAAAFRAAISDTAHYRRCLRSVERTVPTAALRELAVVAYLCRLPVSMNCSTRRSATLEDGMARSLVPSVALLSQLCKGAPTRRGDNGLLQGFRSSQRTNDPRETTSRERRYRRGKSSKRDNAAG
jgi:hypothetical protein